MQLHVFLGLMLIVCFISPANAEATHNYFKKKHAVFVGIFEQSSSGTILAQRGSLEPAYVEFEEVGIATDHTSWMVEYRYRLSDRCKLSAAAYQFENGGSAVVAEDFNFDGIEYKVDAVVEGLFTLDTYVVDAMYSVYQTDNTDVSLGLGLHAFDAEASIQAQVAVAGEGSGSTEQARASLLAPLPNFRASVFHAFDDTWSVMATVGWLSADIDDYSGSFEYVFLRGQYRVSEAVGLSLGYQVVAADITKTLDSGRNEFDITYKGITAAISYAF